MRSKAKASKTTKGEDIDKLIYPIKPYDAADYLKTRADMARYLKACLEDQGPEDPPQLIAMALGAVARAYGISKLARDTGLSRETLHRSLGERGNPNLDTLVRVSRALGLKLTLSVETTKRKRAA